MSLFWRIIAFVALLAGSAAAQQVSKPGEPALDVSVRAIRIGVDDLDAAVKFYTQHLGCEKIGEFRPMGFEMLTNHGVDIVLTKTHGGVNVPPDGCHVRVNFKVPDLDKHVATMKAAGVTFTGEGKSAVGKFATFVDPAGNRHNIKQLDKADPALTSPQVYDIGISVTSMEQGAGFYRDVLGFEELSRDYYPPVVPFKQKGAAFFILSEDAKQTAPYIYGMTASVGFALETKNLLKSVEQLKKHGVAVLHEEPQRSGNVMFVAFSDPFGNMHELIQYADAPKTETATVTVKDLAWMSGRWLRKQGKDDLEETWSPPLGDTAMGMFRWNRDGKTWMYELMSIETEDSGLVFHLRHFGKQLKPWEEDEPLTYPLKSLKPNEVVFEHPTESDPKRFVYRREGDRLFVRLEPEDAAAKVDEFEFTLAK